MTSPAQRLGTTVDVDRLREPLAKFVFGYVRDHHSAEDLVQETLLKVLRNLHRYRGQAAFKTWVFTIARNLCLDFLRNSGRSRLRLLGSLEPDEGEAAAPDPREGLELAESRERVAAAMTALPADARELLLLRVYHGLSYREIARLRGVAPAGMGTRLLRARRGLSRKLRKEALG